MEDKIIMYKKCKDCKYRCTCCSSRNAGECCSGCDRYDEFKPAKNIIYCPIDGNKIENFENKEQNTYMEE